MRGQMVHTCIIQNEIIEPHGRRSPAALLQAQRVRRHGGVMAAPSRSERQTRMQDEAHRGSVGPIT